MAKTRPKVPEHFAFFPDCSVACLPHSKPCVLKKDEHPGTVHFCKDCLVPLQSFLEKNTWLWVASTYVNVRKEKWKAVKNSWPIFVALAVVSEVSAALGSTFGQLVALGIVSIGLLLYLVLQAAVADLQGPMYVCPLCRGMGGRGECEKDGTERVLVRVW